MLDCTSSVGGLYFLGIYCTFFSEYVRLLKVNDIVM